MKQVLDFLRGNRRDVVIGSLLIVAGVASRVLMRELGYPNLEFLTLSAILAALFMQNKVRWLVPLLATALGDVLIPNSKFIMLFTWSAWAVIGFLGSSFLKKDRPNVGIWGKDLILSLLAVAILFGAVFVTPAVFSSTGSISDHLSFVVLVVTIVLAAILFLSAKRHLFARVFGIGMGSSLFFYLFTNFGVWLEGWGYPRTLAGLLDCYVKGLPFLEKQFRGNLLIVPFGLLISFLVVGLLRHLKLRLAGEFSSQKVHS